MYLVDSSTVQVGWHVRIEAAPTWITDTHGIVGLIKHGSGAVHVKPDLFCPKVASCSGMRRTLAP